MRPDLSPSGGIFAEELYNHRGAAVGDFDNERVNLAYSTNEDAERAVRDLRYQLMQFLQTKAVFNFQMAIEKTTKIYSNIYKIDKSGFAIGRVGQNSSAKA